MRHLLLCWLLLAPWWAAAQTTLTGTVRDAQGAPLELVVVALEGQPGGATTGPDGTFRLRLARPLPPGTAAVLVARRLGYQPLRLPLTLPEALGQPLALQLQPDTKALGGVRVRGRAAGTDAREQVSLLQLDPRTAQVIPSPFGDFNAVLKTLPGVVSNNELTSTYGVRGGFERTDLAEMSEPVFLTQAFVYDRAADAAAAFAGDLERYVYSRDANPTVVAFEERLRLIEGAQAARAGA